MFTCNSKNFFRKFCFSMAIFVNNLGKRQLSTKQYASLLFILLFFKQRLYIFCQKLSNENKQRLYKIQKRPTTQSFLSCVAYKTERLQSFPIGIPQKHIKNLFLIPAYFSVINQYFKENLKRNKLNKYVNTQNYRNFRAKIN